MVRGSAFGFWSSAIFTGDVQVGLTGRLSGVMGKVRRSPVWPQGGFVGRWAVVICSIELVEGYRRRAGEMHNPVSRLLRRLERRLLPE